jgi:hypothetical protein
MVVVARPPTSSQRDGNDGRGYLTGDRPPGRNPDSYCSYRSGRRRPGESRKRGREKEEQHHRLPDKRKRRIAAVARETRFAPAATAGRTACHRRPRPAALSRPPRRPALIEPPPPPVLRQSSATPAIPLGLGGLFFFGAGRPPHPNPKFVPRLHRRRRLRVVRRLLLGRSSPPMPAATSPAPAAVTPVSAFASNASQCRSMGREEREEEGNQFDEEIR